MEGLRSRWMTPRSCASATPSQASAHQANASRYGTRALRLEPRSRGPSPRGTRAPGTASRPAPRRGCPTSRRRPTCGVLRRMRTRASRAKRSMTTCSLRAPLREEHLERHALARRVRRLEDGARRAAARAPARSSSGRRRSPRDRRGSPAARARGAGRPSSRRRRSSRAICRARRWSDSSCRGVSVRGMRSATESAPIDEPASDEQRHAGVEADLRVPEDQRVVGEARVLVRVVDDERVVVD